MQDMILECHMLEHNGCPIHYWLAGDACQPLVTFIHGAGTDHHIFDPQIAVTAQFFRVLLWDIRSHGQSQPSSIPFSIQITVDDLVALLDHLRCPVTALFGLSLGGTIAQEVVLRFPERITALIIAGIPCNTIAITLPTHILLSVFMWVTRHASFEATRRFLRHFAAVKSEPRNYVYQAFGQVSQYDLRLIMEEFNAVFQHQHLISGYRVTHPLLLIHGQYDNYGNLWLMPRWARRESHSRYVVVPKAGHLANWDNPSYFNCVLIDFLKLTFKLTRT